MLGKLFLFTIVIFSLISNMNYNFPNTIEPHSLLAVSDNQTEKHTNFVSQNITTATPSCAQPTPEQVTHCREMEQAILASTVRLELFRWLDVDGRKGQYIAGGNSHATIKDGRYLVTHNHFSELLTALRNQGIPGEYIRLTLYRTDGSLILSNIPLADLTIIAEESETLVLEMKGAGNLGFFEMMGLPSAKFATWQTLPLQSGAEVAQIDWNGQTSLVRWTTIESVIMSDSTPQISLAGYVKQGASGGGVFWNGVHIANNWFRTKKQNRETGEVLTQSSIAALNSEQIMAAPPLTVTQEYVTCTQPTTTAEVCAAQEAKILASIVRIVLQADFQKGQQTDFRGNMGHATVMAGRYLVTHNHFSIDFLALSSTNTQGLIDFSLYNASGKRIVRNAPVDTFQVVAQDAQTLVLDFGPDYFNNLNIPSASFIAVKDATLSAGTEVAQLDWDGERAYVVWTTVTQVVNHQDSPHLELDHYAMVGASGGGVFWQGYHIANNWAHVTIIDSDSGVFRRAYSLAALNSQNLLNDHEEGFYIQLTMLR